MQIVNAFKFKKVFQEYRNKFVAGDISDQLFSFNTVEMLFFVVKYTKEGCTIYVVRNVFKFSGCAQENLHI